MQQVDLLIIGAGWNGMAMAKTYREIHPKAAVWVLDSGNSIGGTWAEERLYPGLKTNNVVGSYEFSDFPLVPSKYGIEPGQHIPGNVVHDYLVDFAHEFGFVADVHLRTTVESATLLPDGSWCIAYSTPPRGIDHSESGGAVIAARLVLATGLSSEPFMPPLPGRENFGGLVFHAKAFKTEAAKLAACKSVVVIGGNKSAWDLCYSSAARFGAKAHMVMRRAGGGPSWVWPRQLPGYFSSLSEIASTRFVSWLDPSPFSPSGKRIRAALNRSWLGQKLISLFWGGLDSRVEAVNAYHDHPAMEHLRPWTSTYWMGNSLGIHNYETSWFDLVRNGNITTHTAEVVSLSSGAVHLSDGTSVPADAVVCCTGWKARPTIQFFPEGTSKAIGFPDEFTPEPSLQAQVRSEILRAAPMLKNPPVRTRPTDLASGNTVNSKRKPSGSSPYRLYRFLVPYDPEFIDRRNFAIIGAEITIHTAIVSQAQALWITAFLDGEIPHLNKPNNKLDYEQIKQDTFLHTEYERIRRPREAGGSGERYPDLVVDSIPYVDMLLSDLGLSYHRKSSWFKEITDPYSVIDYKGLVSEWKTRAS